MILIPLLLQRELEQYLSISHLLLLFTEQTALLVCSGNAITYTNYNNSCSLVLKISVSATSINYGLTIVR